MRDTNRQPSDTVLPDFQLLFEQTPLAQLLVRADDPDWTIVGASNALLAQLELTREQVIGQPCACVMHASIGHWRHWMESCVATGTVVVKPLQSDRTRADGQHSTVGQAPTRLRLTPLVGPDSRVQFILQTFEEIPGGAAHTAHDLHERERRLRLAQRVGRIGSFEWLVQEGRILWTPELERLYGIPEGSFEGRFEDWSKRVVEEDAARITREIADCIARQTKEYDYEFRVILPDGKLRWLRGHSQFVFADTGEVVEMLGINIDIDSLKQAQEHIRQQWQTFDAVLKNTPDLMYSFGLDGCFTYANQALLSLLGKRLDEVIGKDFVDLEYPPELAQRLNAQVQEVIASKSSIRDHTPFAGADGKLRQYEYIFVPVWALDGSVEAVAGSTRDITERKLAEELAEQDRRRWRDLLWFAPAAIAVLRGPEHRFEWVNPEYARFVGRDSPDDLAGRPLREALPELSEQGYVDMFEHVYNTGQTHTEQEAFVKLGVAPGDLRDAYAKYTCAATRNSSGEVDGTFVHASEITDLVTARKQIEESEQQFRSLAETIPNLAWMADSSGDIFWYNRRWYEYTGTSFEEMEGWGWQSVHDPNILPTVVERWRAAIVEGKPFEMVFPLRRADGMYRSFLTRVEPVRDALGRVTRWFGTNTDIHDQQMTEAELRRVNRELEEFAYVASHDLQEPLRMVNIYTQLILRSVSTENPKLAQYRAFVHDGVTRMEALIEDLLTFSRTVHTAGLPHSSADLDKALDEALSTLKNRLDESGANLVREPLPHVVGDVNQLAHVFQNLLSNSVKYAKADHAPDIRISATERDHCWTVSVRDNGIGFEPRYAEQIFGLFKRLHKDDYPGTGLGLAICKRIVERYGGRIWAEGKPGIGAEFFFTLPQPDGAMKC